MAVSKITKTRTGSARSPLASLRKKLARGSVGSVRAPPSSQEENPRMKTKIVVLGPYSETRRNACSEFAENRTLEMPKDSIRREIWNDHTYDVRVLSSRVREDIELWDVYGPVEHGLRDGYLVDASMIVIVVPEKDTEEETDEIYEKYRNDVKKNAYRRCARRFASHACPENVRFEKVVVRKGADVEVVVSEFERALREI